MRQPDDPGVEPEPEKTPMRWDEYLILTFGALATALIVAGIALLLGL